MEWSTPSILGKWRLNANSLSSIASQSFLRAKGASTEVSKGLQHTPFDYGNN